MVHHFDHRFATYERDGTIRDTTLEEHQNPTFAPMPRYWVEEGEVEDRLVKRDRDGNVIWRWEQPWLLGFRDITNSTNERTAIFSLVPRVAVNHKLPLIFLSDADADRVLTFLALVNSFAFDYLVRQSVGGTSLGYFLLKQLPIPRPSEVAPPLRSALALAAQRLTSTATRLVVEIDEGTQCQDQEALRMERAKLDAICFLLYGISDAEVEHVMNTFNVLRRRDIAEWGGYRTMEAITNAISQLRRHT